MPMHLVEFIRGTASQTFASQPINRALLQEAAGCLNNTTTRAYYSLKEGDKTTVGVAIVWESEEDSRANRTLRPALQKALFAGHDVETKTTWLHGAVLRVFDAPVTEVSFWTLYDLKDRAELQKYLSLDTEHVEGGRKRGEPDLVWGPVPGNDWVFWLVLPWPSMEVRAMAIEHNIPGMEKIAKMLILSSVDMALYRFQRL